MTRYFTSFTNEYTNHVIMHGVSDERAMHFEIEGEDSTYTVAITRREAVELNRLIQYLLDEPRPASMAVGSIKSPETEDEAVMMTLVATNWLRDHAPHRLTEEAQKLMSGKRP